MKRRLEIQKPYRFFIFFYSFPDGVYRIVYEEVDESEVLLFKFPSSQANGTDYEEYRFPRAGTPNAKSKLKLVQFVLNETLNIQDVIIKDLQYPLSYYFPWMEYIVRVGFTPDAKSIWAQLLDRQQKRVDLVLIPLDNFCEVFSDNCSSASPTIGHAVDHSWMSNLGYVTSPIQVIYSQISPTWININDLFTFIEYGEDEVTFIWASEESGYRHLYLITSSLCQAMNGIVFTDEGDSLNQNPEEKYIGAANLVARIVSKVALTSGEWEVLGRNLWVDRKCHLVYFLGLRETPLEKHLYVVSLDDPDNIRLLSRPGSSYSVDFNEDCTILIQVYCNIHQMPACEVQRLVHTNEMDCLDGIELQSIGFLFEGGNATATQLQKFSPSLFSKQISSGDQLFAMVFRPHNYRHGQRYPTVLNVYGGPEVQTVNNTFKVRGRIVYSISKHKFGNILLFFHQNHQRN